MRLGGMTGREVKMTREQRVDEMTERCRKKPRTAGELIVRMENDLEISIPVVRFLGGPSVDQMVPWLLEEMQDLESVTDVPEADTASPNPVRGNGGG